MCLNIYLVEFRRLPRSHGNDRPEEQRRVLPDPRRVELGLVGVEKVDGGEAAEGEAAGQPCSNRKLSLLTYRVKATANASRSSSTRFLFAGRALELRRWYTLTSVNSLVEFISAFSKSDTTVRLSCALSLVSSAESLPIAPTRPATASSETSIGWTSRKDEVVRTGEGEGP